ncbi:MAG: hypothetical protein Kow0062_03480 [Acidobacteriota bacterium]
MSHGDEFFVGHAPRMPEGTRRRVRRVAAALVACGLALGVALTMLQARFDEGVFEFGVEKTFDGVLLAEPYPVLLVADADGAGPWTILLSAPGKHGADALVADLVGRPVEITGSLIDNGRREMIEVHAVRDLSADARLRAVDAGGESLGRLTLAGEIVDSKCHLGVMKPGRDKTHKACAIRCISGGVPPVLRVEDRHGRLAYFLLVGTDGRAIGRELLSMIAEPVEVTGDVTRFGDLLVMRTEPASIRSPASR